jgi:hypothetical protein
MERDEENRNALFRHDPALSYWNRSVYGFGFDSVQNHRDPGCAEAGVDLGRKLP